MKLLTFLSVLAGSMFGDVLLPAEARASLTHLAKVDVSLGWMSPSGRFEAEVERTLDFRLDWNSRKCEVEYKGIYYYCMLDVESDLRDADQNILMKQVPVAHFGFKSIDALLLTLGREDDGLKNMISKIVTETSSTREKGFLLPFYTCEACTKSGDRVPVWNAYESYVRRNLQIKHPLFSSRKLALFMKIRSMKALGGSFNIIGRTNADTFIEDLR
jgi:hypothetical protein